MGTCISMAVGVAKIMSEIKEEETTVGISHSGIELEEGIRTGISNYCSKCRRNVHCHVKVEGKTAEIVVTCSNDDCECRCRTHFACKRCGYLHPYGMKCDRLEEAQIRSEKNDKEFDEIMTKDWSKEK